MKYELSFIISGALPETEHSVLQREIFAYLEKAPAQNIGRFETVGRRKLAYPISKQKQGFYMYIVFELEDKAGLKELDTQLKHNNNILRHLIVKLEGAALKPKVRREKPPLERVKKTTTVPPSVSLVKEVSIASLGLRDLEDIDKRLDEMLEKEPEV